MSDTLTIQVHDVVGAIATANFIIPVVNPCVVTTFSLPNATQGVSYSAPVSVSGGIPPYAGQVIGNSGANSYSFSGNILIGTPTVVETALLTILMGDSVGVPSAAQFNLTVVPAAGGTLNLVANGGLPAPAAAVGIPYELIIQVTNGTGPYSWLKLSGPAWGSIAVLGANTALFSGTPGSISAADTFVLQATDSLSNTGTITL